MTEESDLRLPAPSATGGLLFAVSVPVHLLVSKDVSVALAAVTLAVIGGAYIGFGARAADARVFWIELTVAVVFGLAALAGLIWHWLALPIGLALHAVWDIAHHRHTFGAPVPAWYISFCVVVDLAFAAFLVLMYAW
jgi:hypothetical protein